MTPALRYLLRLVRDHPCESLFRTFYRRWRFNAVLPDAGQHLVCAAISGVLLIPFGQPLACFPGQSGVRWGNFWSEPAEVTRNKNRVRHWISHKKVDCPGRFGED